VWVPGRDAGRQKNKLTYRWARNGLTPPRQTHDQRTQSTYLFGAVCPPIAAPAPPLVLPACNSEDMQLHLDEIATKVAPGWRTPFSSSIKPAGMVPSNSGFRQHLSPAIAARARPSSTAKKTSGSSCRQNWAIEPRLQILRRHRRSLGLLCLEHPYRHQPWKIMSIAQRRLAGEHRSSIVRIGISHRERLRALLRETMMVSDDKSKR